MNGLNEKLIDEYQAETGKYLYDGLEYYTVWLEQKLHNSVDFDNVQPETLRKIEILMTGRVSTKFDIYLIEKDGKLIGEFKGEYFDVTVQEVDNA